MYCLITRIKVRNLSTVVGIVAAYLRMRYQAKHVSGLREMALLIRPQRTVFLVSLWEDTMAMAKFNTAVPEHPIHVRRMRLANAEVWSGTFELIGTSRTARSWEGLASEELPDTEPKRPLLTEV